MTEEKKPLKGLLTPNTRRFFVLGILLYSSYRVFSLTWSASMQIYWNKRKRLHKKRVQLPQDWFGTPTWPLFHCFGTPIWPPWRHVKTLYCRRPLSILKNKILANVLSYSRTVTTLPQVAAWRVVATNLAQIHFSVMIQESVSAKTTPLAKSVTYVSGDSLGFLMPHAKVGNCTVSFLTCINFAKSIRVIVTFILCTTFGWGRRQFFVIW